MSSSAAWVRVGAIAAAAALLGSACGGDQATAEVGESSALSCESDRDRIVELLQSGSITYDYTAVDDLEALVETSDVVLAGTVGSIGRAGGESDPELGAKSWTVLSVQAPEVLHAPGDVEAPMKKFSYPRLWPDGAGADPLAADVSVEDLAFVAFLGYWEPAPGAYTPYVQGLVVDCVDGETPTPVLEPLPDDAVGLSLRELVRRVRVISAKSG